MSSLGDGRPVTVRRGRGRGRNLVVRASLVVVGLVLLAAIAAPLVATHDPEVGSLADSLARPSADHWLGTDQLGRDVYSRIVFGARIALLAATQATAIAVVLGIPLGLAIGFRGGRVDQVAMRLIDGVSSIPGVVLAIAIIAALGTGLTRSMLAVGLVFSMVMARIARGQVLSERERQYVDGARVVGVRGWRLLVGHLLPNVAPALVVQATLVFSAAITIEAGLSFLGLGVQPPTPSWGIMLADAQDVIAVDAFQSVPPGVAILLTVLAINVLGDALQQVIVGGRRSSGGTVLDAARTVAVVGDRPGDAEQRDTGDAVLVVDGLEIDYRSATGGMMTAVSDVRLHVARSEVLALVGESGCGKSSLGLGLAGLLAPPAELRARSVRIGAPLDDPTAATLEFAGADETTRAAWRRRVSVIFQEPAASLNPVHTVGYHLERALRLHGLDRTAARTRAVELLAEVRINDPADVARRYPHQISGGMAQRVMIALALAQDASVLVADEPTTALDVTVQAEILTLLRRLCEERGLAVLLITHDLGVVAELADRVAVMYAGQVVETGAVLDVVATPRHPYTAALAAAVPRNEAGAGIPEPLEGSVPEPGRWPEGCRFAARCFAAEDACRSGVIETAVAPGRTVVCRRADELTLVGVSPRGVR